MLQVVPPEHGARAALAAVLHAVYPLRGAGGAGGGAGGGVQASHRDPPGHLGQGHPAPPGHPRAAEQQVP